MANSIDASLLAKIYDYSDDKTLNNSLKTQDGQKIEFLGLTDEKLGFDVDGDGTADFNVNLADLEEAELKKAGFTDDEIAQIKSMKTPEQTNGSGDGSGDGTRTKAVVQAELDEVTAQLTPLRAERDRLQGLYDTYKSQSDALEGDYKDIKDEIERLTEDLEADEKKKQQQAIYEAMRDYEKDGEGKDWNTYLSEKLKGVVSDTTTTALIARLTNSATDVITKLGQLQSNLITTGDKLNSIKAQIAPLETKETALKAELETAPDEAPQQTGSGSGSDIPLDGTSPAGQGEMSSKVKNAKSTDMSVDDVKKLVSDEEWELIGDIDLNAKLENGNPRYVIAQGATDGKYHVYDMGGTNSTENGTTYFMSVAREKGDTGMTDCSKVKWDNGWISNVFCEQGSAGTSTDGSQGYYKGNGNVYFVCGDNVKQIESCYSTASPLSFDLNGDGVQISDEIVNFDIDGDGIVDQINNSADAVLVFNKNAGDKDDKGAGEDGSEVFGNNTDLSKWGITEKFDNGFDALRALAEHFGLVNDNGDDVLDEEDLKFLEQEVGLGLKKDGYLGDTTSVTSSITEINLAKKGASTTSTNYDSYGNTLQSTEGATFTTKDGQTRDYGDIWHKKLTDAEVKQQQEEGRISNGYSQSSYDSPEYTDYDMYDDGYLLERENFLLKKDWIQQEKDNLKTA